MKFLLTTLLTVALNVAFTQVVNGNSTETKSNTALFIGTYNIEKKGICSSKVYIMENVKDKTEYETKRIAFKESHKNDESFCTGTRFVSDKECVVIYKYQQRISGWNCSPTVYSIKVGKTLEYCTDEMNVYFEKYPKEFTSAPEIVFSRCNTPQGNKTDCPTYGFKIHATPSYNCASLSWWALSTTTNTVDAQGNFKQNKVPEAISFTLNYRKLGDKIWLTESMPNTGKNVYSLTGLSACTTYEVFMVTTCDNSIQSGPSTTVKFTTACTKPGTTSFQNITTSSVQVSSERLTAMITFPCNSSAEMQQRIVEYKTANGSWMVVICNSGEPCIVTGLTPGTLYKVRTRFKYGDNLFSNYTAEKSFTTIK